MLSAAPLIMKIVRRVSLALAGVSVAATLVVCATPSVADAACAGCRPQLSSATISGTGGTYTVTVRGHGFGHADVAMPFSGDLSNFRIGDSAQGPSGEWGYSGDAHLLRYLVWTPSEVEVSGLGASPGDALVIALWNAVTGRGVTWGGDVPPINAGTPTIKSVSFSSLGTPVDIHVVVKGQGFGPPPRAFPFIGDLNAFSFWDGRSHCGSSAAFTAGGAYFGNAPADAVTLRYLSWSDTKIVIAGFRGSYGTGCSKVRSGDPVAVVVWNSADTAQTGAQSAKRALILYGIPGN